MDKNEEVANKRLKELKGLGYLRLKPRERYKIIGILPAFLGTLSQNFELSKSTSQNPSDPKIYREKQKKALMDFAFLLNYHFKQEISEEDLRGLIYFQIRKSTQHKDRMYESNARDDMEYILKKTVIDPNFVRQLFKIKRMFKINNLQLVVNFLKNYESKGLCGEILKLCENDEIPSEIIEKTKPLFGRFPLENDMTLEEFLQTDYADLRFDNRFSGKSTKRSGQPIECDLLFHKFNEELVRIGENGKIEFTESTSHPDDCYYLYGARCDLVEEKDDILKQAMKIVKEIGDIIVVIAGEWVQFFYPDDVSVEKQKAIVTLFNKCKCLDKISLWPLMIDRSDGIAREPVDLNYVNEIEGKRSIINFLRNTFKDVNPETIYDVEEVDLSSEYEDEEISDEFSGVEGDDTNEKYPFN